MFICFIFSKSANSVLVLSRARSIWIFVVRCRYIGSVPIELSDKFPCVEEAGEDKLSLNNAAVINSLLSFNKTVKHTSKVNNIFSNSKTFLPSKRSDTSYDLESDEDDVQVTIKALPLAPSAYAPNFMKKGPGPSVEKGKFAPEDFEGPMSINGVPAVDFNLEDLEDKPWRKPGADITDFFNFGFTEETWHAYCERHKRLRAESGVGNLNLPRIFTNFQPSTIVNENSKYNTIAKIDVIGVTSSSRRSETEILPPGIGMETKFNPYGSTDYPFYGGYNEPAQISQWSGQEPWRPPPMGVPPPVRMQPPSISSGIRPSADDTEAVTPPPPGADERETSNCPSKFPSIMIHYSNTPGKSWFEAQGHQDHLTTKEIDDGENIETEPEKETKTGTEIVMIRIGKRKVIENETKKETGIGREIESVNVKEIEIGIATGMVIVNERKKENGVSGKNEEEENDLQVEAQHGIRKAKRRNVILILNNLLFAMLSCLLYHFLNFILEVKIVY
nr:EOG090X0BVA [Artemia franciscana]